MTPFEFGALVAGAVVFIGAWSALRGLRPSARERRHAFHIRRARQVIERLGQIAHDGQKLAYLRKINPLTFEELLLEAAERRGHRIYRNKRYSGDGGSDGRIRIDGQMYLVQAKRYRGHINRQHLVAFDQLVAAHGCLGLFCHTGRTGRGARSAFDGARVRVISGQRLLRFIDPDARR